MELKPREPRNIAKSFAAAAIPLVDSTDPTLLAKIFEGQYVVGLGDPTHGTKQSIDLRFHLTRFLVEQMGFGAIAIEASYSAAHRVNAYVLGGKDDLSDAITALGSVMWDTEEFTMVVGWLRAHNEHVGESNKVRFWGLDLFNTRPGREIVLAYLSEVATELVPQAVEVFGQLSAAEARGYLGAHQLVSEDLREHLAEIVHSFTRRKSSLVRASSASEYGRIERELQVISQAVEAQAPHRLPDGQTQLGLDIWARSRFLAENLMTSLADLGSRARVVVWAHNVHVRAGSPDGDGNLAPNMGHTLRQHFGSAYFAFGFEVGEGMYLAREWLVVEHAVGDFTIGRIPPPPSDSLPWHLSRARTGDYLVDLRNGRFPESFRDWIAAPHVMHELGWARGDPPLLYSEIPAGLVYDGLLFSPSSSPTTPSVNALRTVHARSAS